MQISVARQISYIIYYYIVVHSTELTSIDRVYHKYHASARTVFVSPPTPPPPPTHNCIIIILNIIIVRPTVSEVGVHVPMILCERLHYTFADFSRRRRRQRPNCGWPRTTSPTPSPPPPVDTAESLPLAHNRNYTLTHSHFTCA